MCVTERVCRSGCWRHGESEPQREHTLEILYVIDFSFFGGEGWGLLWGYFSFSGYLYLGINMALCLSVTRFICALVRLLVRPQN